MDSLTDRQIMEYFHRSYKTADGLWFMKMEEKHGFDAALEIDKEVWKVMPKIQARMIKSMLGLGEGEAVLLKSLETKLALEGFNFKVEQRENGFQIQISHCPWHDSMVKSEREKYSEKVGTTISGVEYSVWASEFEANMKFALRAQICKVSKYCLLDFERC